MSAADTVPAPRRTGALAAFVLRRPFAAVAALILIAIVAAAVLAPWPGTVDPRKLNVLPRRRPPSEAAWVGSDQFGRDR